MLHHRPELLEILVGPSCCHCTCRIIGSLDEDGLAVHAGFEINDVLGLRVGLLFQRCSVFHCFRKAIVRCCGGRSNVWCIDGVRAGHLSKSSAAFVIIVGLFAFQFAALLSILICEVGLCAPPRLVVALLPVVYFFALNRSQAYIWEKKVAYLVFLRNFDPMVLAFDLSPVQLTGEGCDVCVGRVTSWLEEVCIDRELILCCDDVPRLELLDYRLDGMILVTHVALFDLFHILRVDGRDNGFKIHGI